MMTIEQLWHFQPRRIPVPFLVLHRVIEGRGGFVVDDRRTAVAFSAPTDPCPFLGVTPS